MLFTARYPQGLYNFIAGYLRFYGRVLGYVNLRESFGLIVAFVYGWNMLVVNYSGSRAAVATVFVAAVMFPITVILLERDARGPVHSTGLVKQILLNPMVLSTLIGLMWAIAGLPIPAPVVAYLHMIAAALTPCALFAIGLGLSVEGLRSNLKASFASPP